MGDLGSIPGLRRSPEGGHGNPPQYSWASFVVQRVKKPPECGRPGFDPWVEKIPWRKERLPTAVFWPGEFHGLHSPWGRKESDTTKQLSLSLCFQRILEIIILSEVIQTEKDKSHVISLTCEI